MEQREPDMSTQNPSEMEALRQEIQAAIAAGREVGPDMDQHLADSAIKRYQDEKAARDKALQPRPAPAAPAVTGQPGSPSNEVAARMMVTIAAIAAFVAIMIWRPDFWWVIFFMPAIAGWWGWGRWSGHDQHMASRNEYRNLRRQVKVERMRRQLDAYQRPPDEYV
jgi:hypothetical protein